MKRLKNISVFVATMAIVFASCNNEKVEGGTGTLIPTPAEYTFGIDGGSIIITINSRYWELGVHAGGRYITNQYGVSLADFLEIHDVADFDIAEWLLVERNLDEWGRFEIIYDYILSSDPAISSIVKIKSDWFEVTRDKEFFDRFVVVVQPNTSGNERVIALVASAFLTPTSRITITQSAE